MDLKARHIYLYDPNMGNKYVQNREIENAKCLRFMLPYLLRDGGYYKKLDMLPVLDPFEMTMIKNAPRQDNGYVCIVISNHFYCCSFIVLTRDWFSLMLFCRGDCGMFILKFIEYSSSEKDLLFGREDISWFRKKYAIDLWFNKFSM